MIRALSLLPGCQSATQVAVKLKLDSLPAVPQSVDTFVLLLFLYVCSSVSFYDIGVWRKYSVTVF